MNVASGPAEWYDHSHMPRRTKAEQSAGTRAALLAAGRELFGAQGYDATSAEQVAAKAGVTSGAVYYQFKDKRELFRAVFEDVERQLTVDMFGRARPELPPFEQFKHAIDVFLELSMDPAVRRIVLVDARAVLGWDEWHAVMAAYGLGVVRAGLANLIAAGAIPEQTIEPMANILLGAISEAAIVIAFAEDQDAARQASSRALGRLLESLRAPLA